MLRNILTLKKLVKELKFLKDSKVIECFTQDKNIILINFFDGSNQTFLEINLNNGIESVFYHKSFFRARINSVDIFNEISGLILKDIQIFRNDRIIQFVFENMILNIVLFGFSKNNIILTDSNLNPLKYFKNKGDFEFKHQDFVNNSISTTLGDFLKESDYRFSKELITEFCFQNHFKNNFELNSFQDYLLNQIKDQSKKFIDVVDNHTKSYILENSSGELKFSIYPLTYFGIIKLEFNNLNEGIRRYKSERLSSGNFNSLKVEFIKKINRINSKLDKQLVNIKTLADNKHLINDYKVFGEMLMSYPSPKNKGLSELVAFDWQNCERKIKLNKDKTILENAQNYFNKSKNLKDEIEIKSTWITSINVKKNIIEKLLFNLEKIDNIKELKKFDLKMKELESESNKAIENAESDKYRVFDLGNGFILYVGKSAANNDELTMKFAKANDLWMHARGAAGSHAIIRLKKEENPPKEIIKKAASVVAYYSQARNAKYVPVCYTFKKYVRKPKGANPGSVVLQKETVVMVEPKLPE